MDRRTVVAFVGEDPSASERVSRAVDAVWGGPRGPELRTFVPSDLDGDRGGEDPLNGTCGVVVTAAAATDDAVAERLAALPSNVPVIALVEGATTATFRSLLAAGVDDVVDADGWESTTGGVDASHPLAERLASRLNPDRVRLGDDDVARLADVLLDAGTTLMSTRTDEVGTKIEWTMQNVGEHAKLDRIVCYREDDGQFVPAYGWYPNGPEPESRPFEEFPDPEQLSMFGNVARGSVPPGDADGGGDEIRSAEPPATVHVPLVVDWELSGVVAFESDDPRAWTDDEVGLYRTLGDLIAHTTARNDRRKALRRQAEQLEQFSAVVSHDLRNPLNVISGYLSLSEDELTPARYDAMSGAVDRMETLIDDLLMLARRGEAIGETEPVPIAAVAEEAWGSVRAPDATLTVTEGIGRVEADPGRLRQALENLFRNAIDHGGSEVSIEVGPLTTDGRVGGMYVADDGPGIPVELADAVFDSGVSSADSSGIGLAIVDRIVDAHEWDIEARNDDGAVFELTFGADATPVAST
ncbi:histidine kinase [Halorubrum californiense DSM 19288]|uniref:histidine kinase n=1 Tax=Halorubrum californiense DSM 19288 TaxID=1227465 RepID=M0EDB4_9EURY|nr:MULTISPECIES: ATP-binding protein [Halorubrum]ELZ44419.1 histidine kinase [Halorubrum californiense DSM 19288]TKX71943.1 GAF domain-containing protein [Halorubrum sp. GN11GM_10-3_MGM]